MDIHIFKCELGSTVPEPLTDKEIEFYNWLASTILGVAAVDVNVISDSNIPITNKQIEEGGGAAYKALIDCLNSIPKLKNDDLIVLDIEVRKLSLLRAHSLIHIFSALKSYFDLHAGLVPGKCVILLEDLPPDKDLINNLLKDIAKTTSLFIIDQDGRSDDGFAIDRSEFKKRRLLSKRLPRERIRQKMIKQWGHFQKRYNDKNICIRNFYDGQYCEEDVSEYLFLEFQEVATRETIICYHSKKSPWLRRAVLALKRQLDCMIIDISNEDLPNNYNNIILVLDFIDSGNTLIRLLDKFDKKPEKILSILATRYGECNAGIKTFRNTPYGEVNVDYLLEAEYKKIGDQPCYLCELNIPRDELQALSVSGKIRSLDFWEMVTEAGLCEEINPPDYREPIPQAINCVKLLTENGTFIASRILQLMEQNHFPLDSTIVCPSGEDCSGLLSNKLSLLLSQDIITVPRDVINIYANEIQSREILTQEEWYIKLCSPTVQSCIIIDDFSVTGSTIKGLLSLITELEKSILAVIPIIDFAPHIGKDYTDRLYPLYEWSEINLG